MTRGSLPGMCNFDTWTILSWRKSGAVESKITFSSLNCLKEFRWKSRSRKRTITRDNYEEYGWGVLSWLGAQLGLEIKFLCVPVPQLRCSPNICSSHFLWVVFFPFEVSDPVPFSLAQNGIEASTVWLPVGPLYTKN